MARVPPALAHPLRGYRSGKDFTYRNGTAMHATRFFLAASLVLGTAAPALADWQQEISSYNIG